MGFSRVAIALRYSGRSGALAHHLAVDRLLLAAGRTAERRLSVPIVVPVGVGLARDRVLESAHSLADLTAQRREPPAADDHQDDQQDDGELERAQTRDEGVVHGVGLPPGGITAA